MSSSRPVDRHRSEHPAVAVHRTPAGTDARPRFSDLLRQRKLNRTDGSTVQPPGSDDADPDTPAISAESHDAPVPVLQLCRAAAAGSGLEPEARHAPDADGADGLEALRTEATLVERERIAHLAQTISRFCNDRAVSDSEGWQVSIPLRTDVLPLTTLHLSISSLWLSLRFSSGHAEARELVSRHSDELVRMLETAMTRAREISISID